MVNIIFGKDGYAPAWLVKLFPNKRLKNFVTLYGITDLQQRALYYLVQTPSNQSLETIQHLFNTFVNHGALPAYDDNGAKIKYKRDEIPQKAKTAHIQLPHIEGFKPYIGDELNHLYRTGQITRDEYDNWK